MAHANLELIRPLLLYAIATGRVVWLTGWDSNGINGDSSNFGKLYAQSEVCHAELGVPFFGTGILTPNTFAREFSSSFLAPVVHDGAGLDAFGSGYAAGVKGSGRFGGSHLSVPAGQSKVSGNAGIQSATGATMPAWFPWASGSDLSEAIRFHYAVFGFAAAGTTNERIRLRATRSGADSVLGPEHTPTGAGQDGVQFHSFDVSAMPWTSGHRIRLDASNIVGECGWFLPAVTVPGRPRGLCFSNLFQQDSEGLERLAIDIALASDAYGVAYLTQLAAMTGGAPRVVVNLALGGNDWVHGRTEEQTEADLDVIRGRLRHWWIDLLGWPSERLAFLLESYHPRIESAGFGFRDLFTSYALAHGDVAHYDPSVEFELEDMIAGDEGGTYTENIATGSSAHLTDNGYLGTERRKFGVILASGEPAYPAPGGFANHPAQRGTGTPRVRAFTSMSDPVPSQRGTGNPPNYAGRGAV